MFSFSVIIPHYNIPDLLMRCLKSIPLSEDIQIIVVDDNSPNVDTYKETYPELSRPYLDFIRTTKGGGAGYARNVGLEHAKGKWLLFADADDFFVDNAFGIIKEYENSDADVVYFKKKSVYSADVSKPSTRNRDLNGLIDGYLKDGDEISLRVKYWVPWGKMIKRKLVLDHNFRFDEVKYSNDQYFCVNVGINARKIEADARVLYIVTTREGSLISNGCLKPNEIEIRSEVGFRLQRLLAINNITLSPMPFRSNMLIMLKHDRKLYRKYLKKLNDIYPSTFVGLKDICYGLKFQSKILIFCYSMIVKYL